MIMEQVPLLSIFCVAYNHAPYIVDCLNGLLSQKTSFPIEIIINDDCSTDGTTEILKKYQKMYPDIIRLVLHEQNCYSKGEKQIILSYIYPKARGKYCAICEGDDYWTDTNKLQMQVDFLDSHPDYSMCFHDVDIKTEKGRLWYDVFGKLEDRDYTGMENLITWSVPTCSMVLRKEVYGKLPRNPKFTMGDNVLVLTCGRYGKIRCIPKKMGVYRLSPTSWIGGQSDKVQRYKYISHYYGLIEEFEECRCDEMYQLLESQYFQLLSILKREGDKEEFDKIKAEYLNYPGTSHFDHFSKYYRKSQIRYHLKKIFGKGGTKFIRNIKVLKWK